MKMNDAQLFTMALNLCRRNQCHYVMEPGENALKTEKKERVVGTSLLRGFYFALFGVMETHEGAFADPAFWQHCLFSI